MMLTLFHEIPDNRQGSWVFYDLPNVLFFSILAIMSGANSYRTIHSFIKIHFPKLKEKFKLKWERCPAYTTLRNIIQGVDGKDIEIAFRKHSKIISKLDSSKYKVIAMDGKVLRGSFDHFCDQKAIQIFNVFLTEQNIILAHEEIEEKTNEIPVAQDLVNKLGLSSCIFTMDALHCQKKLLNL